MVDFKTNAVDSFTVKKIGTGKGECKIYLKGKKDKFYRDYFGIDTRLHGTDTKRYKDEKRYRDRGPEVCYIDRDLLLEYIGDALDEDIIDSNEYRDAKTIIKSMSGNLFYVNYVYDNQDRSYIGSNDPTFSKLRNLCKSRSTIVTFKKDDDGDICISLEVGQL